MAIDKGTIDAVLTDVETSDIEKLPENIRSLLGGISKVTKTCFVLISHDKDRKFCSTLHHEIYLKPVLTHIFVQRQALYRVLQWFQVCKYGNSHAWEASVLLLFFCTEQIR